MVRQYNRVVAAWTHNLPTTRPLMHFKTSLPIWKEPRALDLVEEAAAVGQVFNRWIASILKKHPNPSQEELEGPLSFLRAWCQSKLEERRAWAVALWHVVHGSRADSTGSAAFHCFDKEMAELIAETARLPLPVCQVSASNDPVTSKQDSTDNLHTDQPRSMVTPGDSVVIPLVGGVHSHNNDVAAFREAVRSLSDLDDITISTRVRPEHGVGFFVEEMYLGSVPQDHMMFGSILEGLSFTARVNLRGRSIFMMPTSPSWFVAEPARN
ncbi:MAG TPA: hypothetical protein ENH10_09830 [Bacteroidetes bacterium]|nr:hypothetical protein [Bacteroidota bacterium]HEX05432.1 hypothetical protein [Bacteroidota bacterium]